MAYTTDAGTTAVRVSVRIGGGYFRSLSAAAKAVTGRSTNGWKFWRLDPSEDSPDPLPWVVLPL